jgi:hypothetical protein
MFWQRLAAAAPLFGVFDVSLETCLIFLGSIPSGFNAS